MHLEPKKPTLLMLSHCVPDARGDAARARAWQLLRMVCRSHRVYLVCRTDGPVRMDQWEVVRALTHRLVVQMPRAGFWTPTRLSERSGAALAREARDALSCTQPTVLLCTHPALRRYTRHVNARLAVCDIDAPLDRLRYGAGLVRAASSWLTAPWHRASARWGLMPAASSWLAGRRAGTSGAPSVLARTFQMLTLGHHSYVHADDLGGLDALEVPAVVDLDFFSRSTAATQGARDRDPRLVFHTDWRGDGAARGLAWFRRQVWPAVSQAVPGAVLASSQVSSGADPLGPLNDASVVVSGEGAPGSARWPVLQAMTTTRPLIVPPGPAADLGARDGEHLLTAREPGDWASQCIRSLRSAQVRLALARGGRAFLESRGSLEATGSELLGRLGDATAWRRHTANAA